MKETEYWDRLRMRLNGCADMPGWCDWFEPKKYMLDGKSIRIQGRVGFVRGRQSSQLQFEFLANCDAQSIESVDWSLFVPAQNDSSWLNIDKSRDRIAISIPRLHTKH